MKRYLNLIDGKLRTALSGRELDVRCPSDGLPFAKIPASSAMDINAAVKAARAAVDDGEWSHLSAVGRGRLLTKLGDLVLDNLDDLTSIEAMDTGKPMREAEQDIRMTARYFEFYGGSADKIGGETLPYFNMFNAQVLREPHGVTGHIIPWNYPSQIFARTLAPALAMGNAVVLKPAEQACLTPIQLAVLAREAGFPKGSINVVSGTGAMAGAALARHRGIDFLSFTGSPKTGASVAAAAARNRIACSLELGGKSPQIVFEDARKEEYLHILVQGVIQNAGQTCSAGSRVLVQESMFGEVLDGLASRFEALTAGPHDEDPDLGALISNVQKKRVLRYLNLPDRPHLVAQGNVSPSAPAGGHYVRPTLFGPASEHSRLSQEEIFGPVLVCTSFKDERDAVRIANGTEYGLVAGIWTRDGDRQMRVAKALHCGQVFINSYGAGGGVELPFGGVGKSGHGREKGMAALHTFSRLKTVVHHHGL
ncbi:MAG: aldehyde dehydrogenase family protein [Rhodobacteraceae bacterium]|nr:aldehyde dehydrogenase family protein [Paracoccaceae bacterium]